MTELQGYSLLALDSLIVLMLLMNIAFALFISFKYLIPLRLNKPIMTLFYPLVILH